MAIRENRPIFNKPRSRRGGLGPWMLLVLLAVLVGAGLYVFDKRQSEKVEALRAELTRLRSTVEGAAAARKAMQGVASKQIAITGGQLTGLWRGIKSLNDRVKKLEADLQTQAAKVAQSGSAADTRTAAMLKDIAAIRTDMAAVLKRLAELEKRQPVAAPDSAPATKPATPETAPKGDRKGKP